MPPPSRRAVVALCLLLAACRTDGGGGSPSAPAPSPSDVPVLTLEPLEVEPFERQEESIGFAFEHEAATELLTDVPPEIDFDRHAVVCVFLGPRTTTGWSLDLRTAALRDGELEIRARETAPRRGTRPVTTYPADCGLLNRDALPVGELAVRADDTITDEFITSTVVEVPPRPTAP